jgi:AcrR family transcriptional regulator
VSVTDSPRARKQQSPATAPSPADPGPDLRSPQELDGLALRLLHVARHNFVKYGFHKASVNQIAKEAGTSVGLLYYHFRSKQGLYRAIYADYQRTQWRHAHQAVMLLRSAGVTDGRVLFLAGARAYLTNCWEYRDIVNMTINGDVPPGFSVESRAATDEWLHMNTRLLQMPDDHATRVLVRMAAHAIGGACNVITECATREEVDQAVELAMQVFDRMIVPAPAALPAP